jgi:hypothetical protein
MTSIPYTEIAHEITQSHMWPLDMLEEFIRKIKREYWNRNPSKSLDPFTLKAELWRQLERSGFSEGLKAKMHHAFENVFHTEWISGNRHLLAVNDDAYFKREAIECFEHVRPNQVGNQDAIDFLVSLGHDSNQYRTAVVKLKSAIRRLIREHHSAATRARIRALDYAFYMVYGERIIDVQAENIDRPIHAGPSGGQSYFVHDSDEDIPEGGEDVNTLPMAPAGGPLKMQWVSDIHMRQHTGKCESIW